MNTLRLIIPGEPVPKQSVKGRIVKPKFGKPFVQFYQTKEIKQQEETIKSCVIQQLPNDFKMFLGPVVVESIIFAFAPIKSMNKRDRILIDSGNIIYKFTKPDLSDNLPKLIFDALEGVVYKNDSQICYIKNTMKIYSLRPRTEIVLRGIDKK